MKFTDRIKILVKGEKAFDSAGQSIINALIDGGITTNANNKLALAEYFTSYSFFCMNTRASAIANINTIAGYQGATSFEPLPDNHWFMSILKRPNAQTNITWYTIKEQIQYWLDATGNAYLYTPVIANKPSQVWFLQTDRVEFNFNKETGILEGYKVKGNSGQKYNIPVNEICHFKTIYPTKSGTYQTLGRPGILDSIVTDMNIDKNTLEYINRIMESQGLPPLGITFPTAINKDAWPIIESRLDEKIGYKIPKIVLDNNAKIEPLQLTGEMFRMLYKDSMTDSIARKICIAFKVPFAMLLSEFQNKSVAVATLQNFYDNVIESLHRYIDEQLTNHFSIFDEKLIIKHDKYKFIDPVEDIAEKTFELSYGIVTRNELRASKGREPLDGGDEPLISSGFTTWQNMNMLSETTPADEQPQATGFTTWQNMNMLSETTPADEQPQAKGFVNEEIERTKYWNKKENEILPYRRQLLSKVKNTFVALEKEVRANLKKRNKNYSKAGINDDINIFDVDTWREKIGDNVAPVIDRFITEMMGKAAADVDYNFIETEWDKEIKQLTKYSSDKIRESINTIHTDLKQTIKDIIADNPNATRAELLEKIVTRTSDKFSQVYTMSRAQNIATTTTTYANGAAQDTVWKELGFTKQWITQRDGLVRHTHRRADGSKPDAKGNFKIGYDIMKHPGAGLLAEENCYCRCILKAVKK